MRLTDAARVGLTTLAAAALLIAALFLFRGRLGAGGRLERVTFTDAQGIQSGAPVRVLGVDVGTVADVNLASSRTAEVLLRMSREYQIKPTDSIRIVGGLFGFSQPYIEITPGARSAPPAPGGLVGEPGPNTAALVTRSEELLVNLTGLVSRLNRVTEGFARTVENPLLQKRLLATASNFEKVSGSGVVIARNMEQATARTDGLIRDFQGTSRQLEKTLEGAERLLAGFQETAAESRRLMADTRGMVGDTRGVVREAGEAVRGTGALVREAGGLVTDTRAALAENREKLKAVLASLDSSLKQLDGTLAETRSFLGDPELRGDLKSTTRNIRDATENLKKITTDVQGITGDGMVQEDLKVTLTNLRGVSEEASDLVRRVREVVGGGGKAAKSVAQRFSETQVRAEVVRQVERGRTRLDFDATIPWSESAFYRLGLFDFGEANKFNAQRGHPLRNRLWARYGVHASSLGLGLDLGESARPHVTLDLYGLDRPRLDLRGYIPAASFLDVSLGVDGIFRGPTPSIGLRYRQ